MFESLKRLFSPPQHSNAASDAHYFDDGSDTSEAVRRYFELSGAIEQYKADGDFPAAVAAARETYRLLADFVRDTPDAGMLRSHAVHTAPILMAVLEDRQAMDDLRRTLESIPQLHHWLEYADAAARDLSLVQAVMKEVTTAPGVVQTSLKSRLGVTEGQRIGQLAAWLEKGKRISRVRKGPSYQLYPHGQLPSTPSSEQPRGDRLSEMQSVRRRAKPTRQALPVLEISLSNLPIVRLPKAPAAWVERRRDSDADASAKDHSLFSAEGEGWDLLAPEKLPVSARPDPAFKDAYHSSGATFLLDPKGRTERFNSARSVLRVIDRSGRTVGDSGLPYDVYRADVNTEGSAVLFLSHDGVLHAYSDDLSPLLTEWLTDVPEYRAQAERLGIPERELRNHTRCVSISADRAQYLVTVVDEAYCFAVASHRPLWAVRTPMQEGWTRVAQRTDRVGTDSEIHEALRLMELELPVSPDELTQQYRRLAMRSHPDRNPHDQSATARFQALGSAFELLTGADLHGLSATETEVITYEKILHQSRIDIPEAGSIELTFSMGMSEKSAADWIYAANFSHAGKGAYLGTYGGKVLRLSDQGRPTRVYDIGSVPRHIEETQDFLYLLTDTRLYVLEGERLIALVDVFDRGELIIGDTGFGLLESKSFAWFAPDGERLGVLRSKNPIRQIRSTEHGLLAETRQHRVRVPGAQPWWRI